MAPLWQHSDLGETLETKLTEMNGALTSFVDEVTNLGEWNNTVLLSASDFGRTLTSNGRGSDPAWAGNHFLLGGGLDGARIHGRFPADLTESGPLNVGRGRLIPTTPWEGVWKPLAQWFGVEGDAALRRVLPNLANFGEEHLIRREDLFEASAL